MNPTANPTKVPTTNPTADPTKVPTANPTANPTAEPTGLPTANPTANPTAAPSASPTPAPTPLTCPGASIQSFADPIANARLIGSLDHTIAVQAGIDVGACATLCINNDECASFEFKTGALTTNCNLKRVNAAGAGGTIVRATFELYERLLACRTDDPTASPTGSPVCSGTSFNDDVCAAV